jgi:hypothetical protein
MILSHRALPRILPKNIVLLRSTSFHATRRYLNSPQDTSLVVNTSRSSSSSTMAATKSPKFKNLPLNTVGPLDCALTGPALLNSPTFNKGSAFTQTERRDFNLTGLLPANEQTLDHQVKRAYQQYLSRSDNLAKNTFLTSLKDQNEVLYFKLLLTHLKEMFSVVYTPTEGDAIQNYSRLFRRPEGCFLDINHPERVESDLALWGTPDDVDYICVTGMLPLLTLLLSYTNPFLKTARRFLGLATRYIWLSFQQTSQRIILTILVCLLSSRA